MMTDENDNKNSWGSPFGLGIFFTGIGILLYGLSIFLGLFI